MVEHRSHSAGLEYDASAGWKLRKLGRDIRRRRRHLRLVDDRAVSCHDANLRFRHRDIQSSKILHCRSPLPMTGSILSTSGKSHRPLPDVDKVEKPRVTKTRQIAIRWNIAAQHHLRPAENLARCLSAKSAGPPANFLNDAP